MKLAERLAAAQKELADTNRMFGAATEGKVAAERALKAERETNNGLRGTIHELELALAHTRGRLAILDPPKPRPEPPPFVPSTDYVRSTDAPWENPLPYISRPSVASDRYGERKPAPEWYER